MKPDEQIYWDAGKDPMRGLPQVAQIVPQGLVDSIIPPMLGGNLGTERPKVPRAFNISITYTMIEKEIPNADGSDQWKVATDSSVLGGDLAGGRATDLVPPTKKKGINDSGRRFIL